MQSTVGPVRTVNMSYTAAGKSAGVATVVFKNKGDGNKAHSACKFEIEYRSLMPRPQQDD
jgi:hypothetical protein